MKNYRYVFIFLVLIFCACDYSDLTYVGDKVEVNSDMELIFTKNNEYAILKPEFEYLIIKDSKVVGVDEIELVKQDITVRLKDEVSFESNNQNLTGKGYKINVNATIIPKEKNGNLKLSLYLPNIKFIETTLDTRVQFIYKTYNASDQLVTIKEVDVSKNKSNRDWLIRWKKIKIFLIIIFVILVIIFVGIEIEF